MYLEVLSWIGVIGGVIGTCLIASKIYVKWAFVIYLLTTPCLIFYNWKIGSLSQVVLFSVYTFINIIGFWNWVIRPLFKKDKVCDELK